MKSSLVILLIILFFKTCHALLGYVDPKVFSKDNHDIGGNRVVEVPHDRDYINDAENQYNAARSKMNDASKLGVRVNPEASASAQVALSKASAQIDEIYSSVSALYSAKTTLGAKDHKKAVEMIAGAESSAAKYKLEAASYLSKGVELNSKATSGGIAAKLTKAVETSPKYEATSVEVTSVKAEATTTRTTTTSSSKEPTTTLTTSKGTATATSTRTTTKSPSSADNLSVKIAATLIPAILLSIFVVG